MHSLGSAISSVAKSATGGVFSKINSFLGSNVGQGLLNIGGQLIGNALNNNSVSSANQANADLQREFAQNSILWRVQDAKRAGIHPLYAIGAPSFNASPSFVGANSQLDFGSAFQQMTRNNSYDKTLQNQTLQKNNLELQRLALENSKLQAELDNMGQNVLGRGASQVTVRKVSDKLDVPMKETGYEASAPATPRWEGAQIGSKVYLSPSSDSGFQDLYSEGWSEKVKHLFRSILDDEYLENIARDATRRARAKGKLAPDQFYQGDITFNGLIPEPVLRVRSRLEGMERPWAGPNKQGKNHFKRLPRLKDYRK